MKLGSKTAWVLCIASALVLMCASFMRPIATWAQTDGSETGSETTRHICAQLI